MQAIGEITALLLQWKAGDREAFDRLMPIIYPRLRAMAGSLNRGESSEYSLQATELVHEAYVRLLRQRRLAWEDREHFFSFAAKVMRLILTDHARARVAQKRGGSAERVPFNENMAWVSLGGAEMIDLDRALDELELIDAGKVRAVELRYFLGCSAEETGEILGRSKASVDRDLQIARAWLFRRLQGPPAENSAEE